MQHGLRQQSPSRDPAGAAPDQALEGSALMLDRREFVVHLLADRGELLVVTGLGTPTFDVNACGDHPLNFYIWSGMGLSLIHISEPTRLGMISYAVFCLKKKKKKK